MIGNWTYDIVYVVDLDGERWMTRAEYADFLAKQRTLPSWYVRSVDHATKVITLHQ